MMQSLLGLFGGRQEAAASSQPPPTHMPSSGPTEEEYSDERQLDDLLSRQGLSLGAILGRNQSPQSRQLTTSMLCRTARSGDDVSRLCREGGADPSIAVQLETDHPEGKHLTIFSSILCLAIDDINSAPPLIAAGRQLKLPLWPSRELQREVLEALIAAGAGVDGRPCEITPLRVAVLYAQCDGCGGAARPWCGCTRDAAGFLPIERPSILAEPPI
ncbi:unnamed protein product [Vitrella brassicaformis CCMP3155]|uniref:Uncharacterized protein n=1 Tax=Vitrella brassicaformis (strain CCMP3155) TaxID=1169540 RepID=A0A0G4F0T8_VITBC|nr:unnamed protein product [Vitrella brassicaformis CCMP3155]|eukprot:CEM05236.1 unnamed protein product [Vitrella brassicaformis CCMP3155]